MGSWKRIVAVLLVAVIALIVEGWAANAQASAALPETAFFKKCAYTRTGDGSVRPPYSLAPALGTVQVTMQTNRGTLVLTLDRKNAPCAVHSLTHLALLRFYTDTPCRTQATLECGTGRLGYHFPPELTGHETYPRGTVALSNDATGTFYLAGTANAIPPNSPVLGTITTGLNVLDRITTTPTQPVQILQLLIG
jgi:peptidyl-prolyl cis-trans isomerase B (cyclophilin B)